MNFFFPYDFWLAPFFIRIFHKTTCNWSTFTDHLIFITSTNRFFLLKPLLQSRIKVHSRAREKNPAGGSGDKYCFFFVFIHFNIISHNKNATINSARVWHEKKKMNSIKLINSAKGKLIAFHWQFTLSNKQILRWYGENFEKKTVSLTFFLLIFFFFLTIIFFRISKSAQHQKKKYHKWFKFFLLRMCVIGDWTKQMKKKNYKNNKKKQIE